MGWRKRTDGGAGFCGGELVVGAVGLGGDGVVEGGFAGKGYGLVKVGSQ